MFKNTTKTLFVLLALLAMPILLAAQTKFTLKGKVTDAAAEGLIGVNVMVGGTFFGTATDLDGNYQIEGKLKEGEYDAVFSYVGFGVKSAKFTVGSGENMVTTDMQMMEDRMKMDEVVVVGSSVQSTRRQLGNALATVSGDDLAKSGTGNALAALAGRVPGARITQTSGDPAGGINVNLRGINSIRGGSDPLYVIDGVIMSNSSSNVSQTSVDAGEASIGTNRMADLNPNDIESVNVINGAAAAAIYGSRAANGVILISTKRGVAGKAKITVGSSFTMNQLRKRVYVSTYGKQFGGSGLALNTIASVTNPALYPGSKYDTLQRNGANQFLAKNLVDVTRYDYQDDIFEDATGTDNYINVAGGTDKTRYFVGVSYMKNGGIIKNTDFTRYGVRFNLDQQLASWASLSLGINYTNSYANEKPNGNVFFSPINGMTITGNIYDINSKDALGNYKSVDPGRVNPNSVINTFVMNQRVNRTTNNLKLSLFPLAGLKLDIIAGIDAFSQLGTQYIPVYTYAPVNAGNKPTGFAGTANNLSYLFNNDINLSYDKKFGKFSSSTTLGYNYQYQRVDFTNTFGEDLTPGITTVNASAARQAAYAVDQFDVKGFFAQETFGYNNNLFLTAAYRLDNSSKFDKSLGYQGYKKLSLSYIVSDLWAKNTGFTKIMNTAKLRASYGESGGLTGIGSYDRFNQVSSLAYLGKNTLLPSATLANAQVKPERTTEIEFGADLGLFDSRVTLGATYYDQKVADLLVNRTIAASQGGSSLVDNVGTMSNSGIELSVNINPIRTKNFNWDVYGIFNNNKNKIVKLGSPFIQLSTVSGAPAYLIEGQPTTVFFGTYYAAAADGSKLLNKFGLPQTEKGIVVPYKEGDEILPGAYIIAGSQYVPKRASDGQPMALNTAVKVNGKDYIVSELRKVIGNPNPKYTLTWGTNLRFKGLTFGFMLDGVYGNQVFNADKRTRQGVGIGDLAEKEYRGEEKRGTINAIYPIEEWRIDDGAFTKIREVSLAYNFGKMIKGLSEFTISATGRNLYSFDNYNGYDPETNAGGTSDLLRGIDFGNIPIPRSIQFGVKASF